MVGERDPGRYGASFADVYDAWYPGGNEAEVVTHLQRHLRTGSSILELGVGTGRLALPLGSAGFEVLGMDASPEMLTVLRSKDPSRSVRAVLADAGDPSGWDAAGARGPFDCVLAACNLLLNLADAGEQHACVAAVAQRLSPGGIFVVELQPIDRGHSDEVTFAMSEVSVGSPVVITTEGNPLTGAIDGEHIELHDDGSARFRPWSVCPLDLARLDRWCEDYGLELTERSSDYSLGAWTTGSITSVSTYHNSGADRPGPHGDRHPIP